MWRFALEGFILEVSNKEGGMKDEEEVLTIDDLNEFLSAKTYEEQFGILLKHSEKNKKYIEIRRKKMENNNKDYAVSHEEIP